ncbi:prohibitin family protein, partial [bacterium]|nr:prohibitin family protein [bacterium]
MQEFRPPQSPKGLIYGAVIIIIAFIIFRVFTVIPAGHVGVVDLFGKVSPVTLKPGINMRNPLARVTKFTVKTQEMKELMVVPSKEGLSVQLEVSVLFHLNPETAAEVYKTIGPNYRQIILEPNFRSISRGVTATYEARALY